MKLVGIINIVAGVLYCLTIVGLIVGWIPLWIGICMNRASNQIGDGFTIGNDQLTHQGVDSLATAIKILGVILLIGIVINVAMLGIMLLTFIGTVAATAN